MKMGSLFFADKIQKKMQIFCNYQTLYRNIAMYLWD